MKQTTTLLLSLSFLAALGACTDLKKQDEENLVAAAGNKPIAPIEIMPTRGLFSVQVTYTVDRNVTVQPYVGTDLASAQPAELKPARNNAESDTIVASGLKRDTEYLIFLEYRLNESVLRSEPFRFKTPLTVLDRNKTYEKFNGSKSWAGQMAVIEGNEFSVWGQGGFDTQTKVEFVDKKDPQRIVEASFRVASPEELVCIVPDQMTNKTIANYELLREYFLKVNGEVLLSVTYNRPREQKDTCFFYVNNTMPLIAKMKPITPASSKATFYGALFSFFSQQPYYLNIQIVPNDQILWIAQGGTTRAYPKEQIGRFVDTNPEYINPKYTAMHISNGFEFDKSLLTGGETTVWIDFHFGEKVVTTNKFTFTY